ncbi:hypothetical protein [Bacillus paranthracis]|uniref:Uncharacterized protein n=1 Tax=Bacillus paranthracis TaxID=2026186 RepID=A0AAJ1NEQ4_9BACI|nr:hypothetical protein [Bacillus paranthracis]MDG0950506.1 hypothetical protein [Bacillus paranthracis]MDG0955756.1 hypothetical protein [Bacillus paranthracis]
MTKETPIKTLEINGEYVMCDSPVLHEPSAATFVPKKFIFEKEDHTWYIDFFTYARKDFFDFLDKRIDVSVEITDENGNTRQGTALFTGVNNESVEPIEYRMEGVTALEPVKTQPIPEVPKCQMEDLHGKQVTLYYSSSTATTGDYIVEQLFALENAGDSKVGIYVLSCNVKEERK